MQVRSLLRLLLLSSSLLLAPACGGASDAPDGGADGAGGGADVAPDVSTAPDVGADDVAAAPDTAPPPDACVPQCGERVCGPDGCGGSCGACEGDGAVCWDGACCQPTCEGRDCGPDGCGGSCGVCDDRTVCLDGACCLPDCRGRDCGPDGCGGTCGTCESGLCFEGTCCAPDCEGRTCGSDGCGGLCGTCEAPRFCNAEGRCGLPDADHDGIPDVADPFPVDPDRPGEARDGVVYGHTATALYTLDVKTYQAERVATFQGLVGAEEYERRMTDLAVDGYGVVWGVSYLRLYTCHPETGDCTLMVDLEETVAEDEIYEFNALTMVPGALFGELRDVLVGVSNDGGWWRFDVAYEERIVMVTRLGAYGLGRRSSGDAYSIADVGTYAAVDVDGDDADFLVSLDPETGQSDATVVARLDGLEQVFGLAGWTQHAFAFDRSGTILVVDVDAGETVASLVHRERDGDVALCRLGDRDVGAGNPVCTQGAVIEWWGAGVRTRIEE